MTVAPDALIFEPEEIGFHTRLVHPFRGAVIEHCMIGGLRHQDHGRNVFEIDQLARRRLLHPADREVGAIGLVFLDDR